MTLTKDHLITSVSSHLDLTKTKSTQLIESLFQIMRKRLENGEDVLISRFGKFCVKVKNERRGRNPATGEDLMLGKRRVVIFRCSPTLRRKVNEQK